MTRILLDTHAFLWFVFDDPRLSQKAVKAISDPKLEKLIGIASLWEIVIKSQIGRLKLGTTIETFFRNQVQERTVEVIPMEIGHLVTYDRLPLLHRDPFDRVLIAQALSLGVPIVTSDKIFSKYGVRVVW
jgi:PIN domain nuclease of toxin-antitoxin system